MPAGRSTTCTWRCAPDSVSHNAFMRSFASAEFPITAEFRPLSFVAGAVARFVVAGLSLIPAVRAVKRIDVGEIVRERAT